MSLDTSLPIYIKFYAVVCLENRVEDLSPYKLSFLVQISFHYPPLLGCSGGGGVFISIGFIVGKRNIMKQQFHKTKSKIIYNLHRDK